MSEKMTSQIYHFF